MKLPNLLATRRGRLAAFFLLYITEGIPLGFAATAVATQLRRLDVGPAEIGAFVGSFYLPWAFKWAFGPLIDVFVSQRLGPRRGWILGTQVMMALTLLSTMFLDLPQQLGLFTAILLVHNTFGAMQDVAIDALACNTLREDERGLANGLMFGGAMLGSSIGGGGVLLLSSVTGFQPTFLVVTGCILAVTAFVVLPMREEVAAPRSVAAGSRLAQAGREMRDFAVESFRSFLGSQGAFVGVLFSLLPAGAMCLALTMQSNLAVELGFSDAQVGLLGIWSTVLAATFCVAGGWLSDRWGRQRTLAVYLALMSVPVFYFMTELSRLGWVMPTSAANRPVAPAALVTGLWVCTLAYSVAQGLMYGTRSAIMMDVTNPKVAATQFTAYMAMGNLAIAYSATWQGIAVEAWGYPKTMLLDGLLGLLCIALLPYMKRAQAQSSFMDAHGPRRARQLALLLGLACLAWWPFRYWGDAAGAARPIFGTLFTLVFVASALFLLAARAVLGAQAGGLVRAGAWLAPLLLALHLRNYLDALGRWFAPGIDPQVFQQGAHNLMLAVTLAGGMVLLLQSRHAWAAMLAPPEAAEQGPAPAAA